MNELVLDKKLKEHLNLLGVGKVFSDDGKSISSYEKIISGCSLTSREVRFIIGAWNCAKSDN